MEDIFARIVLITTELVPTTSAQSRPLSPLSPLSSILPSRSTTDSLLCRCSVDDECHTRTSLQHLNLHERECRLIRNQLRQSRLRISALEETLARSAAGGGESERKRKREDEGIQEAQKSGKDLKQRLADFRSGRTGHIGDGSGECVLPSPRLRLCLPNLENLDQPPAPNNRQSR